MGEETGTFVEMATYEAQSFAKNIKIHAMDSHEAIKNHFDLIEDEKAQEEIDLKTQEMGEILF